MSPWLALVGLSLAAAYIRLVFGSWPRPELDSIQAPFSKFASRVAILTAISPVAIVAVLVVLLILRVLFRSRPRFDRWMLSAFVGSVVLYLLVIWDPVEFVSWAMD